MRKAFQPFSCAITSEGTSAVGRTKDGSSSVLLRKQNVRLPFIWGKIGYFAHRKNGVDLCYAFLLTLLLLILKNDPPFRLPDTPSYAASCNRVPIRAEAIITNYVVRSKKKGSLLYFRKENKKTSVAICSPTLVF